MLFLKANCCFGDGPILRTYKSERFIYVEDLCRADHADPGDTKSQESVASIRAATNPKAAAAQERREENRSREIFVTRAFKNFECYLATWREPTMEFRKKAREAFRLIVEHIHRRA